MSRLVAFLRGINVGGHIVKMDELRRHFTAVGCKDVETFIASGNVIFATPSRGAEALQQRIEDRLRRALGYEVPTFLRTELEVAGIAGHRPFDAAQLESAVSLNVGFLAEPVRPVGRKRLMALRTEVDDFRVNGREVYWLSRRKISESTISYAALEKALETSATFRGLRTVERIAARLAE